MTPIIRKSAIALAFSFCLPFAAQAADPGVAADKITSGQAADANAQPGFISLEGYMVGRLVIAALEKVDGEPTRKALMEKLTNGSFDLDGVKLTFGANDNQDMDEVFVTVLQKDGTFKAVKQLTATGS